MFFVCSCHSFPFVVPFFFLTNRHHGEMESEAGMEGTGPAPGGRRRLNAYGRVMRRGRIFARMREGWAYDEIGREEGLTAERIRQIVSEVLQKRKVDTGADHAKLQLARLERVMHCAGEALARGDMGVGGLYLKTLDRLDRYQKTAAAAEVYDDEARQRLLDKLNRVAERFGYDKILAENAKIIAEHEANEQRSLAEQASRAARTWRPIMLEEIALGWGLVMLSPRRLR